MVLGKRPTNSH